MIKVKFIPLAIFIVIYCWIVWCIMQRNINFRNTNNNQAPQPPIQTQNQPPLQLAQTQQQAIYQNSFNNYNTPHASTQYVSPNNNNFLSNIFRATGVNIFANTPASRMYMTPSPSQMSAPSNQNGRSFQSTNTFAKSKHKQHHIMNAKRKKEKKDKRQKHFENKLKTKNENNHNHNSHTNNDINIEGVRISTDGIICIDLDDDASLDLNDVDINGNNYDTPVGVPYLQDANGHIFSQQVNNAVPHQTNQVEVMPNPPYNILPLNTNTQPQILSFSQGNAFASTDSNDFTQTQISSFSQGNAFAISDSNGPTQNDEDDSKANMMNSNNQAIDAGAHANNFHASVQIGGGVGGGAIPSVEADSDIIILNSGAQARGGGGRVDSNIPIVNIAEPVGGGAVVDSDIIIINSAAPARGGGAGVDSDIQSAQVSGAGAGGGAHEGGGGDADGSDGDDELQNNQLDVQQIINNNNGNNREQYGCMVQYKTVIPYDAAILAVKTDWINWGYMFRPADGTSQGTVWVQGRQHFITHFMQMFGDAQIEVINITKSDLGDTYFIEQNEPEFVLWQNKYLLPFKLGTAYLSIPIKILHVRDLVLKDGVRDWKIITQKYPTWTVSKEIKAAFDDVYTEWSDREKQQIDEQLYRGAQLLDWQQPIADDVDRAIQDPMSTSNREINYYYDILGEKGKSWLVGYLKLKYPQDIVVISSISEMKNMCELLRYKRNVKVLLVDIPKSEHLPDRMPAMSFFEKVKDRMLTLPKYQCITIGLTYNVFVGILCNQMASPYWWSRDRYNVQKLEQDTVTNNVNLKHVEMDFTMVDL